MHIRSLRCSLISLRLRRLIFLDSSLLIIKVALQILLELSAKRSSMLLNQITSYEWEIISIFVAFCIFLDLFVSLHFFLNHSIAIDKIMIDDLLALFFTLHLQLVFVLHICKKFQCLLSLSLILLCLVFFISSDLLYMGLHDISIAHLLTMVHSFSKFDDVSWIYFTGVAGIPKIPHTLKFK